jgi:hypothetical protein
VKKQYILMADIIDSGNAIQNKLMEDFKELVSLINTQNKTELLSPLTITLGDEFQGVTKGLSSTIKIMIALEERLIKEDKGFKLRYVIVHGEIDTPINSQIAYGMLGEGLTQARNYLQNIKKKSRRFFFSLSDKLKGEALNDLFLVYQSIIDDWTPNRDYDLASRFIDNGYYKSIAFEMGKDRTLIWKRKKSLKIDEYNALKNLAYYLGGNQHE